MEIPNSNTIYWDRGDCMVTYRFVGETTGVHEYEGPDLQDCIDQFNHDMQLHDYNVKQLPDSLQLVHPSLRGDIVIDTLKIEPVA